LCSIVEPPSHLRDGGGCTLVGRNTLLKKISELLQKDADSHRIENEVRIIEGGFVGRERMNVFPSDGDLGALTPMLCSR
jgi:hypothetical protein